MSNKTIQQSDLPQDVNWDDLPDIQNILMPKGADTNIQKVGVKGVEVPVKYFTREDEPIKLKTDVSAYVSLTKETKGFWLMEECQGLIEKINF